MSCANENFYIKDTHFWNVNYKIPCRWCVNCRVDRKKQWIERCNYEFKNKVSGAFVTFTYSDEYLPLVKGNDERIRATLRINDARKFIERLRKYIENHETENNILRQKEFTYLGIGEYGLNGEIFDRPHFHILFFGLDFYYNKKLFEQEWKMGLIDSLPILQGGIAYVLKYIDKQVMGKEARYNNYYRWGLEAPKQFNSKGLGSNLYLDEFENAQRNNGVIKYGMKEIIVPQYYKNKTLMKIDNKKNIKKTVENLKKYDRNIKEPIFWSYDKMQKEMCAINKLSNEIYKIREKNLLARMQANGEQIYIQE